MELPKFFRIAALLSPITVLLLGCAQRASLLPKGNIITSGTMPPSSYLPKNADGKYSTQQAEQLLNTRFQLYEVERSGNSNDVFEISLTGMRVRLSPHPAYSIHGKQFFAAHSDADWSYAGALLSISGEAKYEYLREVDLTAQDPQFEVTYEVNPVELLRHQLAAGNRFTPLVLFQKFVAAPRIVNDYKLLDARSSFNFKVVLDASAVSLLTTDTPLGEHFVFRRYSQHEKVEALFKEETPMFVQAADSIPLSHGKKNVPPDLLRFTVAKVTYRLSDRYRQHLKAEGVFFNCPSNPSLSESTRPPSKRKVTTHPFIIRIR